MILLNIFIKSGAFSGVVATRCGYETEQGRAAGISAVDRCDYRFGQITF